MTLGEPRCDWLAPDFRKPPEFSAHMAEVDSAELIAQMSYKWVFPLKHEFIADRTIAKHN